MAATQYLCTYKPDEKVKEQKKSTQHFPPYEKNKQPQSNKQTNKQNVAIFGKMKFSNADTYIP